MEMMADLATPKSDRESDKLPVERLQNAMISLCGKGVDQSNNSSALAVMRFVLDKIHNHNHIIPKHISSLSERGIRTAHPHSIDDVIYPNMWRNIYDIIGESLVEMSIKAQVWILYLSKEYKRESK